VFKEITISQFSLTWKMQPQTCCSSSVFMQMHNMPIYSSFNCSKKRLPCSVHCKYEGIYMLKRPADTSECGHSLWWYSRLINHRFCCVEGVLGWCINFVETNFSKLYGEICFEGLMKIKHNWPNAINRNMFSNKLSICNWLVVDTPEWSISIFYMCIAIWYWPKIVAFWNFNTFW
jgi:hypothetical protein